MHLPKVLPRIAGAGLLALLTLAAFPLHATEQDITSMIENAKTAADHEAIAAYYDRQAAEAKKQAELHRKMQKSYALGSATGKSSVTPFPQHCAALVKHYENAAQEYTTLAAAHRDAAKAAK